MSEKTEIILLAGGFLIFGTIALIKHKSFAGKTAEQLKNRRFIKWTRFDYSENYYRLLYKFGGIIFIAESILIFLSVLFGGKEHRAESIGNYIVPGLAITIMICGAAFIIYVGYKFGNKK